MTRRVNVIGGGPGGLYVARLLKLHDPGLEVVVHERMDGSQATFGFGVGLTEATMRNLEQADPETAERVREVSYVGHELRFAAPDRSVCLHGARNLAVGRAELLRVLGEAATEVGVDYRAGSRADLGTVTGDVVIAADGVGSATRTKLSAELGVRTSLGRTRYMWCGAPFAVSSAFFAAAQRERELFVTHAYPYAEDRSTFLIEVDDETWESAGLGGFDAATGPGETDEQSVQLLEKVLADQLRGGELLTNRTRWSRFVNLGLDRWHSGNVVLLGDAAHTAHYTLGSGTKLALEDAIALAGALAGESSPSAAFAAYEQARRPAVERFKQLAGRSQRWWDSYRWRADWPAERLGLSYMTRSGNLTMADYARSEPTVVRTALEWLGTAPSGDLDEWVLAQPLQHNDLQLRSRITTRAGLGPVEEFAWSDPDVWGATEVGAGAGPLLLTGSADEFWARVDLAERLRLQTRRCVGVELPQSARAFAATSIGAGRADFAVLN
ncbi:FAD-dependent monooxygenase [Amycolatopsis jejuensis]|uniref:FAD-dependent monooxygenase n=1 Tax=Amycolatopsis jejuensis TaxID=330084 RepID=UPI00052767B5|nr:FAD-dependent monooxygenase [Amycolatopsis jejuensis]